MSWQNIYGHDDIALEFARANQRGRLGGSFLFVGPAGIGKRSFAFALAKALLCKNLFPWPGPTQPFESPDELARFTPCNDCPSCRLFNASLPADFSDQSSTDLSEQSSTSPSSRSLSGVSKRTLSGQTKRSSTTTSKRQSSDLSKRTLPTSLKQPSSDSIPLSNEPIINHPDFFYICKPPERTQLPLELLIGEKENRMRAGLCFDIARTATLGGRKVAVIDDADFFNDEGANALLKTLEEPPENTIIILIGTSTAKQLPTIRSRCQILRFTKLSTRVLTDILTEKKLIEPPEIALQIAKESDGSIARALEIADDDLDRFRGPFLAGLVSEPFDPIQQATDLNAFIEAAGKEAQPRRNRLRLVLTIALAFYRNLLAFRTGAPKNVIPVALQAICERALDSRRTDPLVLVRSAEKTLDALNQIDRNVNVPYIIDYWFDRLADGVFND